MASGKSALVHRYLTGTYVQEESPEGMLCGRPTLSLLKFSCSLFSVVTMTYHVWRQ